MTNKIFLFIGLFATLIVVFEYLPYIYENERKKDTTDMLIAPVIMDIISSFLFALYAAHLTDVPFLLTSIISYLVGSILLVQYYEYQDSESAAVQ